MVTVQTQKPKKRGKYNCLPRKKVVFTPLKIRADVALRFKERAINDGKSYSDSLDELLKNEYLEHLIKDTPYSSTISNLLEHISRRSKETPLRPV